MAMPASERKRRAVSAAFPPGLTVSALPGPRERADGPVTRAARARAIGPRRSGEIRVHAPKPRRSDPRATAERPAGPLPSARQGPGRGPVAPRDRTAPKPDRAACQRPRSDSARGFFPALLRPEPRAGERTTTARSAPSPRGFAAMPCRSHPAAVDGRKQSRRDRVGRDVAAACQEALRPRVLVAHGANDDRVAWLR